MLVICGMVGYRCIADKPVVHKFHITTVHNGDSVLEAQSADKIDSLMYMIENHERELSEKYQYLIEREDKEDTFLSIGLMIVGAVISIAGFFGYRSLKDIREEAQERAKREAHIVVLKYLEENLQSRVGKSAEILYKSDAANVMRQSIKDELRKEWRIEEERIEGKGDDPKLDDTTNEAPSHKDVEESEEMF